MSRKIGTFSEISVSNSRDRLRTSTPAAHTRQLGEARRKDDEICRRDLPITIGRKSRRFSSLRSSVTLPHAPGLSHSLPADKLLYQCTAPLGNTPTLFSGLCPQIRTKTRCLCNTP